MRRRVSGGRRVLGVLAPWLFLVAGCANGGDDAPAGAADPSTSTTGAAGSAAQGEPGATASTGGTGGGPAGTAGDAPPGAPRASSTTAGPAGSVITVGSLRVGEVAPALLRPGRGDRVVLEVRTQEGAAPSGATLDHLVQELSSASGKQVTVDGPDLIGGGERDWTQQEIVSAATSAAQIESGRAQVVLRLLFLRGTFRGDTGVLGVAVAGDVAAILSDQVDNAAGLLVSPTVIEDAVAMHEVGHLLGLVDLLLGTGRGDPEHPGHSRNQGSVMFWQVESGLITQLLDGGIPNDFDADDRAELAQIGAG